MRIRVVLFALACAAICALPVAASAKHKVKKKSATTYYLSLGDSLSQGVQPNSTGTSVETKQGYADQLYASLKKQKKYKGLKLVKLGCPGETTTSMMNGGICKYAAGNQLAQAVKFLKKHKGKVALVTIDIGANDVDKCVVNGAVDYVCIGNGVKTINANVPKIAAALRKAGGTKVTMVGMTYYDPFLAMYLQGSSGQTLAAESVGLDKTVNTDITNGYTPSQFKIADVAATFSTYTPFTTTTTYNGQTVPVAVARICQWTWECTAKPQGPNIHANKTGYKEIATTFKGTL